jgi:hypothetical protein
MLLLGSGNESGAYVFIDTKDLDGFVCSFSLGFFLFFILFPLFLQRDQSQTQDDQSSDFEGVETYLAPCRPSELYDLICIILPSFAFSTFLRFSPVELRCDPPNGVMNEWMGELRIVEPKGSIDHVNVILDNLILSVCILSALLALFL